jgi:diguanylate cyclase (GGDEF)-like protein
MAPAGAEVRRGIAAEVESERLAALDRYDILDSPAEASFDRITALVRTVLDVPMAAVSLIDRDRQWFKSHPGLEASETPRDIAFCDYTIARGAPFIVPDAGADARFRDNPLVTGGPSIGSYAGVPLTSRDGHHVGTLCAIDAAPRIFTASQIEILTSLAAIIVDELELRQIARHDHLTGALARRAFVAEATRAIARRDRYGRPCALVLFDLDHFKAINDSRGHAAGDVVLRAVTMTCLPALRANDVIGRVGGEEFGLLLPELGGNQALAAADRFRGEIAAMAGVAVTASFGVAPLTPDITTTGAWFAAADLAQFAAKRAGRNCCRLFGDPDVRAVG